MTDVKVHKKSPVENQQGLKSLIHQAVLECPFHIDTSKYAMVAVALIIVAARNKVIEQKLRLEILAAAIGQQARKHLAAEITAV